MTFVHRFARDSVVSALEHARGVCLLGPRQAGKSTLARSLVDDGILRSYVTLDDRQRLNAAIADPVGFIADLDGPTVIDEVQRAPDLLLELKRVLDLDDAPGQFLLTGSADIRMLRSVADTLPGRVRFLRMWPFAQGELLGRCTTFIDDAFKGRIPRVNAQPAGRTAYADRIVMGGFPEAVRIDEDTARAEFFDSYVEYLVGRTLPDADAPRDPSSLARLLRLLAARSSGLLNVSDAASALAASERSVRTWIALLESMMVVKALPPWHPNLSKRQIKSPKLHIVDGGLHCALIGVDRTRIVEDDTVTGAAFESFVVMEVLRSGSWADTRFDAYHFRDKDKREVDLVLERRDGTCIGIEVKAAASTHERDFRGLRHVKDVLGDRFAAGIVLYAGEATTSFGDRLSAVPISALWQ